MIFRNILAFTIILIGALINTNAVEKQDQWQNAFGVLTVVVGATAVQPLPRNKDND